MSGCQPHHVLARALFRVECCHLLTMSSHRGEGEGSLWDPFYTGTNSIPDLVASQMYHLFNTIIFGGQDFNIGISEGTQTFRP